MNESWDINQSLVLGDAVDALTMNKTSKIEMIKTHRSDFTVQHVRKIEAR